MTKSIARSATKENYKVNRLTKLTNSKRERTNNRRYRGMGRER